MNDKKKWDLKGIALFSLSGLLILGVILNAVNKSEKADSNSYVSDISKHTSMLEIIEKSCIAHREPAFTYQEQADYCKCFTKELSTQYPTISGLDRYISRTEAQLLADDSFQNIAVDCVLEVM